MPHTFSDQAIVLRTYDVGEADRFCILLTREHGRLPARATGVRRLTSRRGATLLTFQCIDIELSQRSGGQYVIASASIHESFGDISGDLHAYGMAQQGAELILTLIDDGQAVEDIYDLTHAFLSACASHADALLYPAFAMQLLDRLGTLPSLTLSVVSHRPLEAKAGIAFSRRRGGFCQLDEEPGSARVPDDLYALLCSVLRAPIDRLPVAPVALARRVQAFVTMMLVDQLEGGGLKSAPVAVRISSGGTPI